ncbi:bifunctional demethylmenaquinone methyltransferase/2-methoxy-6-polyprenyl-1,4-benzoquinol methylase UbiE [Lactobacillus crispatus]|uniref:bifunctional demethylmenaquinone methyltransferase/2-methoxy-6-polyprenyl-1,4-benzoquinol methylase UbiE n=1 Tax=Lactobacillus crispatus TaxID=47770 RepID=UPI0039F6A2B9
MLTNKVPEQDVHDLFTRVAPKYDLMNNIVSLGIQKSWRKKFLRQLDLNKNSICLDLCCGSADSTIDLAKKAKLVTGLDFNQEMLKIAQKKIRQKQLQTKIKLIAGDAMNLPFAANSFDCVTICFGLRNVPNAAKTIQESYRVLKPGGQFAVLEMSQPTNALVKLGWQAYFKIFPYFSKLTHGNIKDYQYLSKTSKEFLSAEQLKKLLEQNGFTRVAVTKLTYGAGAIHVGRKD